MGMNRLYDYSRLLSKWWKMRLVLINNKTVTRYEWIESNSNDDRYSSINQSIPTIVLDHVCNFDDVFAFLVFLTRLEGVFLQQHQLTNHSLSCRSVRLNTEPHRGEWRPIGNLTKRPPWQGHHHTGDQAARWRHNIVLDLHSLTWDFGEMEAI